MAVWGFIGTGIMGEPMAQNLLRTGAELRVWNRTAAKCSALVSAGAVLCSTSREVCANSDVTFAMLADPAVAREVFFAESGALSGLGKGHDYVDMSTVDPGTSCLLAEAATAAGARFLEAPVSGTQKPAEDGTLIILAAGSSDLYADVTSALEAMGKLNLWLGKIGQGARMKLVVNMIMGGMMTAFGEGMALAAQAGLETSELLSVLAAGAMANPMFDGKGPAMTRGEFPTAFPLKHMQKDLRLALALGDELAQPLPNAAAANSTFIRARHAGLADHDFSAVYKVIGGKIG